MPEPTFYFYDLETSGLDPRCHRIMQFAGQRTTMDLEPVGEPHNILVRLTEDVLPSPDGILITGLTPQQTQHDGITEAELLRLLAREVFIPGTVMTGFNNVRFDDVFLRYLHYRNFYDPYEWAYGDGRSRWDLLDVMRMARALRPDGFEWPVDEAGRPVNKLALLSAANHLEHLKAHDALSDVQALIAVAKHLRACQPKLFQYLFELRSKHEVTKIIQPGSFEPFIYTSGRYGADHHFTTIACVIGSGRHNTALVYDLRYDPTDYLDIAPETLVANRFATAEDRAKPDYKPFPVKELTPGNCPTVAPMATLNQASSERIHLDTLTASRHLENLKSSGLIATLTSIMTAPREFEAATDVDARLYDGFFGSADKAQMQRIRNASSSELAQLQPAFTDPRLPELYLRYKARNYPEVLISEEQSSWEAYRRDRLQADWPGFIETFDRLATAATPAEQALLTDLKLWAESLAPSDE